MPNDREKSSHSNQAIKIPSPLTTILTVWILSFTVLGLGFVKYEGISLKSWGVLYIIFALLLFVLGFKLAERLRFALRSTNSGSIALQDYRANDLKRFGFLISLFAWCGIIAGLLFSFEMVFKLGINPTDLLSTREAYIYRKASFFSQIAAVLGAGGYLSLVSAVVYWNNLSRGRKVLWLLSPCVLSLFSFLSAGRQTVFQLLLFAFFSFLIRKNIHFNWARFFKYIIVFGVLIIMVVAYGMVASYQRNVQQSEITKKDLLIMLFRVQFDPRIDAFLEILPPILRDGSAEMVVYYTHEIPNFLVFWDLP